MKILVIEDDADIASNIGQYFEDKGHQLDFAYNGAHGLAMALAERFDLIILDLMLPGKDGITVCREFRQQASHDTPILMLTARDTLDDKITGFEAGTDDYLVKPFHLSELVARVHSVTRRTRLQGEEILSFGVIRVLPEERKCFVGEELVDLTKKELDLLLYLMSNRNRVITKESIADFLWGEYGGGYGSYDFVYTHLKNLRRKLIKSNCPDYIKNMYGVGYKFTLE